MREAGSVKTGKAVRTGETVEADKTARRVPYRFGSYLGERG